MMILLLSLLGFVPFALSSDCPPREDISPCRCHDYDTGVDLTLECVDKSTSIDELERILKAFDSKNTLSIKLHQLNLGPVQTSFFEGLKVKRLEFKHCKVDGVLVDAGRAFIGLEDTLEELRIDSTFTAENAISKFDLSHLRRLKKMYLTSNSIVELANDWFEDGPASLTTLFLSKNNIEKLGDTAFANLVNLKNFNLNGNRFGSITRSMLPSPANSLYDLELEYNGFTSLPEDIFSGMPILRFLSLIGNSLTKIPKETFQPIWSQITVFDFIGNKLECDSHLEWLFKEVPFGGVYGHCFSPPDKKGQDLALLIERGHL